MSNTDVLLKLTNKGEQPKLVDAVKFEVGLKILIGLMRVSLHPLIPSATSLTFFNPDELYV